MPRYSWGAERQAMNQELVEHMCKDLDKEFLTQDFNLNVKAKTEGKPK
jgi:hypothetical protein